MDLLNVINFNKISDYKLNKIYSEPNQSGLKNDRILITLK